MAPKTMSSSITNTTLKTGSIIWVPYRKSPKWPAVVKNVYPKKVTYFFLPEPPRGKPPTFKTTPKSACLFKETDTLPANANKDLQEAYKAAIAIMRGEMHLRSISNNNVRSSEADPASPSTSTTSSLVETPVKKPRRSIITEGQELVPYTVILVDTAEAPNWPALFVEKCDELEVLVRRFPLTENTESQRFPLNWCHNIAYDGIENLIASNDCKGFPAYVRALVAAQEFMENPQNYVTLPEGFSFPQKPRTVLTEKSKRSVKKDVEMDEEEEEKVVKEDVVVKPIQNGLTLSNLSISSSKNDVFKAMLTYEAREHVGSIFAGQYESKRNREYERAEDAADAAFSFYCGDLLNFPELEMVVAEIHNWIALSPKLPKMSILGEMHYISKVVLPELCIFALAAVNQVSPKDAEMLYLKVTTDRNRSSSNQSKRGNSRPMEAPSIQPVTNAGNKFEQLLRAVSIERSK